MTPSFASTITQGQASFATSPASISGTVAESLSVGDRVILVFMEAAGTGNPIVAVTDTLGNTYAQDTAWLQSNERDGLGPGTIQVFSTDVSVAASAGSPITWTLSYRGGSDEGMDFAPYYAALHFEGVGGYYTSDSDESGSSGGVEYGTEGSGSLTVGVANRYVGDLVVGVAVYDGGSASTDPRWTTISSGWGSSANKPIIAYQVLSATSTTFTTSGSGPALAMLASYHVGTGIVAGSMVASGGLSGAFRVGKSSGRRGMI